MDDAGKFLRHFVAQIAALRAKMNVWKAFFVKNELATALFLKFLLRYAKKVLILRRLLRKKCKKCCPEAPEEGRNTPL